MRLGEIMNTVRAKSFWQDDRGAGTVMGLLWLILLVGITGVAVDIINDSRTRMMLQATADADAAPLGDAINLPAPAAVVASAVTGGARTTER